MTSPNKLATIAILLFIPFLYFLFLSQGARSWSMTLLYIPGIIATITLAVLSLKQQSKTKKTSLKAYIALLLAVLMIVLTIIDYTTMERYNAGYYDFCENNNGICINETISCPEGTIGMGDLYTLGKCDQGKKCCMRVGS